MKHRLNTALWIGNRHLRRFRRFLGLSSGIFCVGVYSEEVLLIAL